MSNFLCFTVRFLDPEPAFHGRRDGGQPEWPPSPLRLFQALLDAAASRWRNATFVQYAKPALEWLQELEPPVILAPCHHIGTPFRIAVPNNDLDVWARPISKGNEPKKQPNELKTMKTVRRTRLLGSTPDDNAVRYLLQIPDGNASHLDVLKTAARSVTHLGWGVDMVATDVDVLSTRDVAELRGHRWEPGSGSGTSLRVPKAGTLQALIEKHRAFLGRLSDGGFRPVAPLAAFQVIRYRLATDPVARPFVIFELLNDDDSRFSYSQDKLVCLAGMVRHLAIAAMKNSQPEGVAEDWVETYVAGHAKPSELDHRQFSYLPLPSMGHVHTDPAVRRVMVAAPVGDERLLDHLARYLSGQRLKPTPQTLLENPPTLVEIGGDKVTDCYTKAANTWASVTPVILPGHDDHKPDKTRRLILKALQQSGVDQPCKFEWSAFSHFAKSLTAYKYDRQKRPTGYIRPDHLLNLSAVHVQIQFENDRQVPGPLAIGAGRHCGLGIFARVE